ncbi:MAG: hypothetical protein IJV48_03795 [Ruminococcus sp.]|nr:hypothetical protein [Ruminococcus sp.]
MKRNNLLFYVLFGMTAVFPIFYSCRRIFLHGYTVLFDGWIICADVRNIIMIGICTAMLIFKDKRAGRMAKILLIFSLMLLPVSRLLMIICFAEGYIGTISTLDSVIYLSVIVILIVTAWIYIKANWLMTIEIIIFCVLLGISVFYSIFPLMFAYEKVSDVVDIPSPDGIHHVRVIEYADDDVKDWHIKVVFTYNSAESFSIGSMEFMKDYCLIDQDHEIDIDSQITFQDNETITVKNKTYTYDGEYVAESPEPPL